MIAPLFGVCQELDYTGDVWMYDSGSWARQKSSNLDMMAIWGSDATHIWAVGTIGRISRYDGTRWVREESGTINDLCGIFGTDANHVWAVGNYGSVPTH